MIRRNIKHTLCVIMVGSSVSIWGMDGVTIIRANSQESGHEVLIRPPGVNSGTASPVPLSRGLRRRNSAPDAGGSHDLRRALAALILNQDSSFNERQALASPSANSLHTHCPDSPRSSDEKNSIPMPKTPETPATPVGYILSSIEKAVIEVQLENEDSDDGCIFERIRCFPQEVFSRHSHAEAQDYGTIYLKVDPITKQCSLGKIELNEHLIAPNQLKASIKQDLELRATALAGERQRELKQEGVEIAEIESAL